MKGGFNKVFRNFASMKGNSILDKVSRRPSTEILIFV